LPFLPFTVEQALGGHRTKKNRQHVSQNFTTIRISGNISPTTENFQKKFARLLYVHIYADANFVQLPLTQRKLCHIKLEHQLRFYISLKNAKNCDTSAPISTKFGYDAEHVCEVHAWLLKTSISKIQNGGQPPS